MGVYIRGMEMPKDCLKCPFCLFADGYWKCLVDGSHADFGGTCRPQNCTLVQVPTPHGRLIDADALMNEFEKAQRTMQQHGREYSCSFMSSSQEISTEWYCVEDMLENAPTIIEEGE